MEANTLPPAPEIKLEGLAEEIERLEKVDAKMRKALQARIDEGVTMRASLAAIRKRLQGALGEVGEMRSQEARGEKIDAKAMAKAREAVAFNRQEVEELEATVQAHDRKEGAASAEADQAARDLAEAKLRQVAIRRHLQYVKFLDIVGALVVEVRNIQELDKQGFQLAGPKYSLPQYGGITDTLRVFGLDSGGYNSDCNFQNCRIEPPHHTEKKLAELIRIHATVATRQENYDMACEKAIQRDPLPSRPVLAVVDGEEAA